MSCVHFNATQKKTKKRKRNKTTMTRSIGKTRKTTDRGTKERERKRQM